jgi:hypothetical protein
MLNKRFCVKQLTPGDSGFGRRAKRSFHCRFRGCQMKKILITVMMCVLLLCQTGWGCKDEPQDFVGGLVDIVLDVVTMPCSLLATCLGLDAGPCVSQQCSMPCCAPSNGCYRCPCCCRTRKSMVSHSVPVARSLAHKNKSEPAKSVEPLIPVKKSGTEVPVPALNRSFPEPARFTEPKAQTAPPMAPEMSSASSTASGIVASPPEPLPPRAPETETAPQRVEIRPKLPDVIPLAPDNFISKPKEEIQEVRKPVVSEHGVAEAKVENPLPAPEVVATKNAPEKKEIVKEKPKQRSKSQKSPCTPVYPPACGPRFFYR